MDIDFVKQVSWVIKKYLLALPDYTALNPFLTGDKLLRPLTGTAGLYE